MKQVIALTCDKNTVSSHLKLLLSERNALVEGISFRDKRLGWQKYSFSLTLSTTDESGNKNTVSLSESLNENLFMRGFLANLYLRPSCYACPANKGKSGSDITLGDYWGISSLMPDYDDDKGISAISVNTEKGKRRCMPHLMWTTDRLLMKPSANGIRHWSELVTSRRTEKDFSTYGMLLTSNA